MRLKAEIWIKAYIRRCNNQGAYAMVIKRGDSDAGAIYIKINTLDGFAKLLTPAPAGFETGNVDRMWILHEEGKAVSEEAIDNFLEKEKKYDSDIWIIEVESRNGELYLDEEIMDMNKVKF